MLTSAIWSCRSVQYVPAESKTDSVIIERLIPVELPPDSATIRALLECDEHGQVVLRWLDIANSKNAHAQMTIDSLGNLLAKMKTRPDTVYMPSKETTVTKEVKVPYPVEKELTLWQRIKIEAGGYTIAAIILLVIFFIVRFFVINKK